MADEGTDDDDGEVDESTSPSPSTPRAVALPHPSSGAVQHARVGIPKVSLSSLRLHEASVAGFKVACEPEAAVEHHSSYASASPFLNHSHASSTKSPPHQPNSSGAEFGASAQVFSACDA